MQLPHLIMELKKAVVQWLLEKDSADYHHGVILLMKTGTQLFGLNQETPENRLRVRRLLQDKLIKKQLGGEIEKLAITQKVKTQESNKELSMVEMSLEARLQIDKRNLYNERRHLSNALHDCNSDTERKRVYEKIMSIEKSYQEQIKRIKYLEETGKDLNEVLDRPAQTLSDDPVELMRQKANIRSNISKKLRIMEQFPAGHPKNIKAHTMYLNMKKKLEEIEEKINNR